MVARAASDKKNLHDAITKLYPNGIYAPLRHAIVQLHNFASAFPNSRHGGTASQALDADTLTGVKRAAMIASTNP